jgi:hypothetical protein
MSNFAEMASLEQKENGVDINVTGEVERQKVDAMLEQCNAGACSCCGPEFIEQLDGIGVEGQDGDVTIHVRGSVSKDVIAEKMSMCDCYGN